MFYCKHDIPNHPFQYYIVPKISQGVQYKKSTTKKKKKKLRIKLRISISIMEDVSCRFILLCSIVFIFTSTYSSNPIATHVSTISSATKPLRIVTKLIHFRSVLSPFYVSNYTMGNYTSWLEERSNTRLAYLKARTGILSTNADAEAELIAEKYGAIFLADISIGSPPVSQYVVMDTGSDLLWVHCSSCIGCDNFDEDRVIFDPNESSTYRRVLCDTTYCLPYPEGGCNWNDETCLFKIGYVSAPSATGNLSSETLTSTTSVVETTIPNIVFGCSSVAINEANGILGLSADKISLVSQLGSSKFSYCIGDVMDTEYMHNKLVFGGGAVIQGDSTPFEVYDSGYHLKLERISLGDERVNIDPITFQRDSEGNGGVVIDSGTAYTYLLRSAYDPLMEEVRRLIDSADLQRFHHPKKPERLCYNGSLFQDLHGFPTLTFHFSGGADLVLENRSMFETVYEGNAFCFTIFISEETSGMDYSLIGLMAQQNFNVGYDLSANTISFQMIDCELLYPDD